MAVIYRTRDDLESQRAAAINDATAPGSMSQDRSLGVLAVLDWALGTTATAPVTGRKIAQISLDDILSEHSVADAIVSRRSAPDNRTMDWYSGTDQTLLWLISDTTSRPMATEQAFLKPRPVIAQTLSALRARQQAPEVMTGESVRLGGAVAALGWVLGESRSPTTGQAAVSPDGPTAAEVDEEARASDDQRHSPSPPRDGAWLYLCAVDDALSWVLDDTNFPFTL